MKRIENAKQQYEKIPIPQELSERVMLEIKKADRKNINLIRGNSFMKKGAVAVAAAVVILTVGVNTSQSFANEMKNIPIIGTIANVLTVRHYEDNTEDFSISVDIPSIELISEELNGLEKNVNEEIYEFCNQYANEAKNRVYEYKKAFIDTGGTEKEWAEHNITIKVLYEIKSQTDKYLSLMIMGTDNWSGAYSDVIYYNFDIEASKWITLKDILGDDYVQLAEQSILYQIKQREKETGFEYWYDEYKGIDENTKFYMSNEGKPVIVFEKYEIAPGAAGQQEFIIDIQHL